MNRRGAAAGRTSAQTSSSSSACSAAGSGSSATAAASSGSNGSPATAAASSTRRASGASAASSAASAAATAGGTESSIAPTASRGKCRDARELLEVEGVAAGLREDRRGRLADELDRLGLAERRRAAAPSRGPRGARRRARATGRRAAGPRAPRSPAARARPAAAHERGERVQRRRVGPLHVVDPDDQRPGRREPLEQVAQRAVRAVPVAGRGRRVPASGNSAASGAGSASPIRATRRSPGSARWRSSASVHSAYGRSCSNSEARAPSTVAPSCAADAARCASSRDLPIPGSPSTDHRRGRAVPAARRRSPRARGPARPARVAATSCTSAILASDPPRTRARLGSSTDDRDRRRAGHCPAWTTKRSIPPCASATCTCASPTSTARSAFYRDALGFGVSADARELGLGHGPAGRRRLPPPHRPEHVRQRRRHAAPARSHRPLSRRVPVPRPARARPRRAPAARPRRRDRPRHRPRRHRLGLPRRSRRQRRRALLRPPARGLVRRRRAPGAQGRPLRLPRPPPRATQGP